MIGQTDFTNSKSPALVKTGTFQPSAIVFLLIASMLFGIRPTLGQQLSDTAYGKRVLELRQLKKGVLDKRIEAAGMLRVAGELSRKKLRPQSEANMIVPRYDGFTKTLVNVQRQKEEIMAPIATMKSSADVTALRQKLEMIKRSMELNFKKQQARYRRLRDSSRQKGVKAKNNRRLQAVIQQQKQDKQAYDERLKQVIEQLKAIRGIESEGAPGGFYDNTGNLLHYASTAFEFIDMPSRKKGRLWVEKQAVYARLASTEQRVKLRDAYQKDAAVLKLEVDQMVDKAGKLMSGPDASDDLRQLAELLGKEIVRPTASARIALTSESTDSESSSHHKDITVLRQKISVSGQSGEMKFSATLSPGLTLKEIHSPQWALKFKDKYPMIHSRGVLSLWVGQFYIAITPGDDLARKASPGNRSIMLQWIDDTLKLDKLAKL